MVEELGKLDGSRSADGWQVADAILYGRNTRLFPDGQARDRHCHSTVRCNSIGCSHLAEALKCREDLGDWVQVLDSQMD